MNSHTIQKQLDIDSSQQQLRTYLDQYGFEDEAIIPVISSLTEERVREVIKTYFWERLGKKVTLDRFQLPQHVLNTISKVFRENLPPVDVREKISVPRFKLDISNMSSSRLLEYRITENIKKLDIENNITLECSLFLGECSRVTCLDNLTRSDFDDMTALLSSIQNPDHPMFGKWIIALSKQGTPEHKQYQKIIFTLEDQLERKNIVEKIIKESNDEIKDLINSDVSFEKLPDEILLHSKQRVEYSLRSKIISCLDTISQINYLDTLLSAINRRTKKLANPAAALLNTNTTPWRTKNTKTYNRIKMLLNTRRQHLAGEAKLYAEIEKNIAEQAQKFLKWQETKERPIANLELKIASPCKDEKAEWQQVFNDFKAGLERSSAYKIIILEVIGSRKLTKDNAIDICKAIKSHYRRRFFNPVSLENMIHFLKSENLYIETAAVSAAPRPGL
jgi:hypothetical protein